MFRFSSYPALFLAFRFALLAAFFSLGVLDGAVFPDFCFPSFSLDIVFIFY